MLVLGIESTCDETAVALVRSGREILSHVIGSQADIHATFGGVVPELAARHHIDAIIPLVEQCFSTSSYAPRQVDLIAVAKGPGLIGSLLVGLQTAKALAWSLNRPLVGVNHIEAHLYASMMTVDSIEQHLPAIGVILSGGHTTLVMIKDLGSYTIIGQTVDDASGEAFDKVAKMLCLGYPGGPQIEQKALTGSPSAFPFRGGTVKDHPLDFSFSGLKTAVLYTIRSLESQTTTKEGLSESGHLISLSRSSCPRDAKDRDHHSLPETVVCDICASFQRAVIYDLAKKISAACKLFRPKALFFGGGVTQNRTLRSHFSQTLELPLFWPGPQLSLDNAAMIAGLGFHTYRQTQRDERFSLEPETRISF